MACLSVIRMDWNIMETVKTRQQSILTFEDIPMHLCITSNEEITSGKASSLCSLTVIAKQSQRFHVPFPCSDSVQDVVATQ